MAADLNISPTAKKNWEEMQKKFDVPVNALGMKINPTDQSLLKIWKDLGLDRFVKK